MLLATARLCSAEPQVASDHTPAILYAGTAGRFEVITITPAHGPVVVELSDAVWQQLSGVLALPPGGFTTPVTVRLIPESMWQGDDAGHRVWVETAGLVTLRVRVGEVLDQRRLVDALVAALITKRASINVLNGDRAVLPLWLHAACAQWVLARLQPSLHDQWQQECRGVTPPPVVTLLGWPEARPRPPSFDVAAYGVLQWLHAQGAENGEWNEFLRRQLSGKSALESLAAFRSSGWLSLDDLELHWTVMFHDLATRHTLPLFSISDSRALIQRWSRVVLLDTRGGFDVVVSSDGMLERRSDAAVRDLAVNRIAEIEGMLGVLHAFYLNAANSLGRFFLLVSQRGSVDETREAWALFEQDLKDADGLSLESARLLDAAQLSAGR